MIQGRWAVRMTRRRLEREIPMHRMRDHFGRAGFILTGCLALGLGLPTGVRGDLIRPDAAQSFPDLSGDIVGTQNYAYDKTSGRGLFQVNSAPSILALGPKQSSEFYVYDLPGQARSQSIQMTLDSTGHLISGSGNSYSLYGSVTVAGQSYSGLLLQGTPDQFGYLPQTQAMGAMSVYDLHMTLSGGLLKGFYGPDAYVRVIAETNSSFSGSFSQSFVGLKTLTNVRAYNSPSPAPVPEPGTFAILLVFGGAGLFYHRRRGERRRLGAED